jgi:osmotically-inducible protein OsmY
MTDEQIYQRVLNELNAVAGVRDSCLYVDVTDGAVTLLGFVDRPEQKYDVEECAKRVYGVRAVANDLVVKPRWSGERPDPEIAREAVWTLEMANMVVPTKRVLVTVRDGWITLEGEVDWQYQSDAAEEAMQGLDGVKGVSNWIAVRPHAPAWDDMWNEIRTLLLREAAHDMDRPMHDGPERIKGRFRAGSPPGPLSPAR